jgi:hypothetical protein
MSQVSTVSSSTARNVLSPKARFARRVAGMLESYVAGIPCLIEVDTCNVVKGSFDRGCDSDMDYYGYSEIEFSVYDRKGYAAKWLEKKMTDADKNRIENEIIESNQE